MANVTDPLIRAVMGTDPQNLMEYITRQKIYDSRFWKEECFGLTAADVLEKTATTLSCIGGTYGGNHRPSKFLCLILKLLQLQPDLDLVLEFINQDHFKYVRALGAFYLRLTARPVDIHEALEPLYSDYSKLRFRGVTEWKLMHMDEFVDELFTQPFACSIAMPRLPHRETLRAEGYLEEGQRNTALKEILEEAGGIEEYLKYKVKIEKSAGAITVWERFHGKSKEQKTEKKPEAHIEDAVEQGEIVVIQADRPSTAERPEDDSGFPSSKRKSNNRDESTKKKKKPKYGSLFKKEKSKDIKKRAESSEQASQKVDEGSEEYWNNERAKLGLKPLNKK
jgi:pre-mRNA-splicing factor 38A